jgi:hypothetical protein
MRRVALFMLLVVGCAPRFGTFVPRSEEPACTDGELAVLDQRGCDGYCPVYTITLCSNGAVVYDGLVFVKTHGRHVRRLDPVAFARLRAKLQAAPTGPSPLGDELGSNPPHLAVHESGGRRWIARTTSGKTYAEDFIRETGAEPWIGSEEERERLRSR